MSYNEILDELNKAYPYPPEWSMPYKKSKTETIQDLFIYLTMVSVLIASWKFILGT